jgi:hypothetical protein
MLRLAWLQILARLELAKQPITPYVRDKTTTFLMDQVIRTLENFHIDDPLLPQIIANDYHY